jgi:hypothetical protein
MEGLRVQRGTCDVPTVSVMLSREEKRRRSSYLPRWTASKAPATYLPYNARRLWTGMRRIKLVYIQLDEKTEIIVEHTFRR